MKKKTLSGKFKPNMHDRITSKIEKMDETQSEFVRKAVNQRMRYLDRE